MPPLRMGVVGDGSIAVRGILPHVSQEDVQDRVVLEAARHVVDIVESAYRAAETGRTQELRTTFP